MNPKNSLNPANPCTGAALLYPEPRRVRPSLPSPQPRRGAGVSSSATSANLRPLSVLAVFFLLLQIVAVVVLLPIALQAAPQQWSPQKANSWYATQPWPVGSNFIPSTAINELEMWQADTFDLPTIDRELGWAESIGMNTMRVFLHNLAWKQDRAGFLNRVEKFLQAADKHHIKIMFVLLDSVWDPEPKIGKQGAPRPHVHNSGWV
jgi:hypothetical protein